MPLVSVTEFTNTHFDYVVVGGGTSGLTVAARLSEDPNIVVGVIEAGEHHTDVPEINMPGMMGRTIANPAYDWTFFSSAQAHVGDRKTLQPRGKGLGGSSMINFMGMTRPSKAECDAFERLQNPGWNWASLLTYMKKAENTQVGNYSSKEAEAYALRPELSLHGTNGPVTKSWPQHLSEAQPLVLDAGEKLGLPRNAEAGNGIIIGGTTPFCSIDPATGRRSYAASAYFEPNAHRSNLKVLTSAQVTKMVLEPDRNAGLKRVVALEFHHDKSTVKFDRFKNVILSAGSFQTPQVLELSGVGDETRLSGLGIDVAVNLPGVGENLQDHLFVPTIVEIDPSIETTDILHDPEGLKKHQGLYELKRGFFASCPTPCFLFAPAKTFGSDQDIKTWKQKLEEAKSSISSSLHPSVKEGIRKQYDILSGWVDDETQAQGEILNFNGHFPVPHPLPVKGRRYASLFSAIMHPLSRGSVHISSTDPLSAPIIDPNYFGVESDLDVLVSILKFTLKFYQTKPLSDIVKNRILPDPASVDIENENSLKEYIKATVGCVFHPVGTASMLPREWGGVVDSNLRVYGTSNLRVVDVSILPIEVATHIQSLAYAIGEKAADIIKAGHE